MCQCIPACIHLLCSTAFSHLQEDGCGATVWGTAKLYNFTSYNNGIHGVEFSIVGHVQIIGFKVSDNRDNGIEIQETIGDWGGALIVVRRYVNPLTLHTSPVGQWVQHQLMTLWLWMSAHLLLCRTLLWYPTPVPAMAVQGPVASRHPTPQD